MSDEPRIPVPPSDDESFTAWPLIIAIGLAKLATFAVILVYAWNSESLALIGATVGPWLMVAVGLLAAPVAYHLRRRRVRRRRDALLRAEWMAPEQGGGGDAARAERPHRRDDRAA